MYVMKWKRKENSNNINNVIEIKIFIQNYEDAKPYASMYL
jgi:hypothetical protein